jgi:hypothetical protein
LDTPPPRSPGPTNRTAQFVAIAACAWSLLFALISTYWGLGGSFGTDHLALSIQEDLRDDDTTLLIENWSGVAAKLVWALLAWTMFRRVTRFRRIVLLLGWATGILLTLYGGLGIVEKALMQAGVVDIATSIGEDALIWYLLLWDPYWLLGGLLFLAATWMYQRETR